MTSQVVPWREIEPLPAVNSGLPSLLETLDALRVAWDDALGRISAAEFEETRRRNLRRHAIETGIIERLYDVDWGVTAALVAEGLTAEVAFREGGIDESTLAVVRTQFDALEFLVEEIREGRDLGVFLVRQLHQLITKHQMTYEGHDQLGRAVQVPLRKGDWKLDPNHVLRPDGTLLEYAPPEQVQSEMERLVELYGQTKDAHPVVRAAWLHHRFIRIHPFEDGNGRVARALTLLVLLQNRYAPLVVDRREREVYLRALDVANDGDLVPLIRLFGRLEIAALRAELERPTKPEPAAAGAIDVARAYAERLGALRAAEATEKSAAAESLAVAVHDRLATHLAQFASELKHVFQAFDPDTKQSIDHAAPPDTRASYWKRQLVRAARQVDFYTNLAEGSWWVRVHLNVLGERLRYIAAVQKVGRGQTGVLALTVYAEAVQSDGEAQSVEPLLELTPLDSVTLVYSDRVDDRWAEIEEFLDRTLAAAVDAFGQRL